MSILPNQGSVHYTLRTNIAYIWSVEFMSLHLCCIHFAINICGNAKNKISNSVIKYYINGENYNL